MKITKRIAAGLSTVLLLGTFAGCTGSQDDGQITNGQAGQEGSNMTTIKSDIPSIVSDGLGGHSFCVNGKQYVVWGVETDQWLSAASNIPMINKYVEASKYVNANCLAVHAPWAMFEKEKDVYDFTVLEYYLKQAEKGGLKVVIYFTSTNYAAGNMQFVPDYIKYDTETYSRVQGDPKYFSDVPVGDQPALPACPSDPDLLEREKKAYVELVKFLKEYDVNRNVLAIQVGGETNFLFALKPEWWGMKNEDIRCECPDCNKAFADFNGSNLEFMTQQFAVYIKEIIYAGAEVYDIPTYTCSSPIEYWNGDWRYAENSEVRKAIVNKDNYIVGPTIAHSKTISTYMKEMDQWGADKIPGNVVWVSGLDTGHGTPGSPQEDIGIDSWQHLELAPWFNILHYNSLGAIYWDHPTVSITKEDAGQPVREKLRAMWSPLRAASAILPEYKSAGEDTMVWWHYRQADCSGNLGGFGITAQQNKETNYGFILKLDEGDIVLAATTYEDGATTFTVTVPDGAEGLIFERGHFDDDGNWVKTDSFTPEISGNVITFQISGDHGDYTKTLYRICREA